MSHFEGAGNVPNPRFGIGYLCYVHIDPELHSRNFQSACCVLGLRGNRVDYNRDLDGKTRSRRGGGRPSWILAEFIYEDNHEAFIVVGDMRDQLLAETIEWRINAIEKHQQCFNQWIPTIRHRPARPVETRVF